MLPNRFEKFCQIRLREDLMSKSNLTHLRKEMQMKGPVQMHKITPRSFYLSAIMVWSSFFMLTTTNVFHFVNGCPVFGGFVLLLPAEKKTPKTGQL